ncbi:XkdQ/YqbQ family protein [Acidaminococcus intestini]|uniref:XkdQ/YqbQ family protein n=1 Tax=Acidaminococcus intestini TaxID=187327 RepID=UPI002670E377|nr:hypothetical protein [Acidaminococcus intestini]
MNNFRLTYSYDGTTRDMTPYCSNIARSDQIDQLGEELTFDLIDNPLDANYKGNRLEFGGKVCFENNGKTVYTGIIEEESRDGLSTYKYKAYDYAWFLNKDQVFVQLVDCTATDGIKKICNKKSIPLGEVAQMNTIINKVYNGDNIAKALKDIIAQETAATGVEYRMEVRLDKLYIIKRNDLKVKATYRIAPNEMPFDVTDVIGDYTAESSVKDIVTKVVVTSGREKDAAVIATAENKDAAKVYGEVVHYETVTDKEKPDAQKIANQKLKELCRKKISKRLKLFGSDEVRSGRVLTFKNNELGLVGDFLVLSAAHTYDNLNHFMTLEIQSTKDNAEGVVQNA